MAPTSLVDPVERHKFYFQYVTVPTADTPGTLLQLVFDQKRYLFGRVSEGSQRACTERGVHLKKTRNFFLTGPTLWETNGGILGMILTIADVAAETGEEEKRNLGLVNIHGGPKLWHTIACARRFIFRTGMPMNTYEIPAGEWRPSKEPDYHDENILLWTLPVKSVAASADMLSDHLEHEQKLRKRTVDNMFNSDWHKDKLHETTFSDIVLPAMVWVRDASTKDLQATWCTKPSDAPHITPDQKVLVRMPWPAALVTELPPADNLPRGVAMSYFVKGRPQRGKFDPSKAKAAGVPTGKLFGNLSNGSTITLENGVIVKPEDVMGPVMPGYGAAVLDIPHQGYLPDLAEKLNKLKEADVLVDTHAFCWTLGPGVATSEAFQQITKQFFHVKHFIAGREFLPDNLSFDASAASTTRLHAIRPDTFMIPKYNNTNTQEDELPKDLIRAERGLAFTMAPNFDIDRNTIPENLNLDRVRASISEDTRHLIPQPSSEVEGIKQPYSDVSVTTLGTGSAVPSKYRNVSGNLLHIPDLGYFVFDCGENTIGQLRRIYNPEQLDEVLCNLHMVWISHLHADHHLGTVSLLVERAAAVQRRAKAGRPVKHDLHLVSERNMADFLGDYKSIEDHGAIMVRCLNSKLTDLQDQDFSLGASSLPIKELLSTRVSHCHGAQAVSVTFANGFKFSYSGDCRPSANFAEIGKDTDILLHEATFDDGMEGDAMAKRHCTIGEALGVAHKMRAKNIILTHFSQRYQKLPTLSDVKFADQIHFEDEGRGIKNGVIEDPNDAPISTFQDLVTAATEDQDRAPGSTGPKMPKLKQETSLQAAAKERPICIAFDFMRVTIPQIRDMHEYYPAIESMFEYEQQKSDEKRDANRAAGEAQASAKKQKSAPKPKSEKKEKKQTSSNKQNGRKNKKPDSQTTKTGSTQAVDDLMTEPYTDRDNSTAKSAKRNARSSSPRDSLSGKKQKLT